MDYKKIKEFERWARKAYFKASGNSNVMLIPKDKLREWLPGFKRDVIIQVLENMQQSLGYGEQVIRVFPGGRNISVENWIQEFIDHVKQKEQA